jgi:hypothetical protein
MSTRATVYIHWAEDEWVLDIKLYHHFDWYVEYLGQKLNDACMKRNKHKNKKSLLENILFIWGFEQAWPLHGDVEYVYHITHDTHSERDDEKNERIRINDFILECQSWFDEEKILQKEKILLSKRRKWEKKNLNWKQAEIDLGNKELFIQWYLD